MKKKLIGVIIILAIIGIAIFLGVQDNNEDIELLNLKTIVKTIEKQGINLDKDKTISRKDFEVEGVKPTIYSVDKDKGTLFVYVFDTMDERKSVFDSDEPAGNEWIFVAKNTCLIYKMVVYEGIEIEEYLRISKPISLISESVLMDLNDGKVIVFEGESSNWLVTYTVKYYEYWWKNEEGKLRYETKYKGLSELQYKLKDVSAVGPIGVEYKGGSFSGNTLNADGYLKSSRGSGGLNLKKDEELTYIVRWNEEVEEIILEETIYKNY